MTESLVHDGDLSFTEADRERLSGYPQASRRTVILQRTDRGVSFSKPVLYPLLAAPGIPPGANVLALSLAGRAIRARRAAMSRRIQLKVWDVSRADFERRFTRQ